MWDLDTTKAINDAPARYRASTAARQHVPPAPSMPTTKEQSLRKLLTRVLTVLPEAYVQLRQDIARELGIELNDR